MKSSIGQNLKKKKTTIKLENPTQNNKNLFTQLNFCFNR